MSLNVNISMFDVVIQKKERESEFQQKRKRASE
jgi:hypothetical protein